MRNESDMKLDSNEVYIVGVECCSEQTNWDSVKVFTNKNLAELYADGISAAFGNPFIKRFVIQNYGTEKLLIHEPKGN